MEGWATMAKRLGSLVFALSVLLVAYPPPAGGTKSQDCPAAKPAPPGKNTSTPSTPTAPIAPPPRLTVEVGQVSLAGILVVTSDQEKTFSCMWPIKLRKFLRNNYYWELCQSRENPFDISGPGLRYGCSTFLPGP